MSKETYDEAVSRLYLDCRYRAAEAIARIEKHGGRIVWQSEPKEPPPPAVCTCHIGHKVGPEHINTCPLWTPL